MSLKARIQNDIKSAMKAKNKAELTTLRSIMAVVRKKEIDSQSILNTDEDIIPSIEQQIKQRNESIKLYQKAERNELAHKEQQEVDILKRYLPAALSEAEIDQVIEQAIAETQATNMRQMKTVMAQLKPKVVGRADMSIVSQKIKIRLS